MSHPTSITSHRFPKFIREHKLLQKSKFKTVFPKIGLKNITEKLKSRKPLSLKVKIGKKNIDLSWMVKSAVDHIYDSGIGDVRDYEALLLYGSSLPCTLPKNATISFSAEGMRGAWDIATMSMRGIDSCMGWNSDRSGALVGSILDPFTGVVYISDGTNCNIAGYEYKRRNYGSGSKMIARAVVRLGYSKTLKKPVLALEPIYCNDTLYRQKVYSIIPYFIDFLTKRTKNKFPIFFSLLYEEMELPSGIQMIRSKNIVELEASDNIKQFHTYSDNGLQYGNSTITDPLFRQFR